MRDEELVSKPHIVIVEDNPADVLLLRMALDEQGEPYQLTVLSDGAQALRFVQEYRSGMKDDDPCAILLDLRLPKYDGLEVLRALKREPSLDNVHVVMVTSGPVPSGDDAEIRALGGILRQKPGSVSDVLLLAAYILELCKEPALV
jgi:CheY-like chemotaxis protein